MGGWVALFNFSFLHNKLYDIFITVLYWEANFADLNESDGLLIHYHLNYYPPVKAIIVRIKVGYLVTTGVLIDNPVCPYISFKQMPRSSFHVK